MNPSPSVAVIIVCMGNPEDTNLCLESCLKENIPGLRVLVVENGTTDNVKTLSPIYPQVKFTALPQNEGFAGGVNRGILEAKSLWKPDYYFLINNDATLEPGALKVLLDSMEKNPDCGLAAPKILFNPTDRTVWSAGGEFIPFRFLGRNRGQGEKDSGQYDRTEKLSFLSGCALLVREEAVRKIGLLDETFFIYSEDLDYSIRAGKAGLGLLYEPKAVAYHQGSATSGNQYQPFQSFYRWRNRFWLAYKHAGFFHKWFLFKIFFPVLILRDISTYRRLRQDGSIPFLWKGLRQFIDLAGFGNNPEPLRVVHPELSAKTVPSRLRGGYLVRNPLLLWALRIVDGLGCRFWRAGFDIPVPEDPKKILIAKIDHLGDLILALRVLPSLKKRFPNARLHWVCGSWAKPLLEGHPHLEKILTFDHFMLNRSGPLPLRILKDIRDEIGLIFALRREKYDLGLDLRAYFPNFLPLFYLGGVRYRMGFSTAGFGFVLHKKVYWTGGLHETEHFYDLLRPLLVFPDEGDLDLGYLRDGTPAAGKKYRVIHVGAGQAVKRWKAEEWRKLISRFESDGFAVFCTGSAAEKALVDETVKGTGAQNLCGQTSLPALAKLLKGADCVVGTDSFVPHLAAAMGTPTAAIFNGIENVSQWRPLGRNAKTISKEVPCSPCYLKNGCATMDCLDVRAEDILALLSGVSR